VNQPDHIPEEEAHARPRKIGLVGLMRNPRAPTHPSAIPRPNRSAACTVKARDTRTATDLGGAVKGSAAVGGVTAR
jgi:hypothetical protein